MSSPEPRRSGRERKQVRQFLSGDSNQSKKRKRLEDAQSTDPETETDFQDLEGLPSSSEDDASSGEDVPYVWRPQPKPKTTKAAKSLENGKAKGKKAGDGALKKTRGPAKGLRVNGRKKKGEDVDMNAIAQEIALKDDNVLFNAILNPAAALQSTVEDFLESYKNSPSAALADLITCILRTCGCNSSVDSDEVMDSDGVVDFLADLVEELKQGSNQPYPLISKLAVLRKFRKSLAEFFRRLILSAAETGSLYGTDLMTILQTWVIAMSSAQLRSFRHTATVIALEVESALASVGADIEKESETVERQREGEKKRKGKGAVGGRVKDLEAKAAEIKGRRDQLMEYVQEFLDGVFVHRYRDHDPGIRMECVKELGVWFKTYPAHFLSGNYLRYIGWVLSDKDTHVRLEAVKSLGHLYAKDDYISTLRGFTERFKPRLTAMATTDIDVSIRVAIIQVLSTIDSQGLLDEEQRETLCLLIFDAEHRVRKAVSGFVKGVWEEAVEEKLNGRRGGNKELDRQRAGIKCLATLLLKWGKLLEKRTGAEASESQDEGLEERQSSSVNPQEISDLMDANGGASSSGASIKGRMGLCVEALWGEVDAVKEWTALLDLLLLDHTSEVGLQEGGSPSRRRAKKVGKMKGKSAMETDEDQDEDRVDELWRLDEKEETLLIEVLLACLKKVKLEVTSAKKKNDDDSTSADMTRVLINALPNLFAKNKTDEGRVADIVLIPQVMNLDLYVEMRMITAYEALWDDITKHFLSHTSPIVLHNTIATIKYLLEASSLSNTNGTELVELEDELSTSLRDAVAGREELEIAEFSEDEIRVLGGVIARLAVLIKIRDMCSWTEEDEGGKQSSAWDIICAVIDRGRFGYKEEEILVQDSLNFLALHIFWKSKNLTGEEDPSPDQARVRESLKEQREIFLSKLTELAFGKNSNVCKGVKRVAFHQLLSIHIVFSPMETDAPYERRRALNVVKLELPEQEQISCAGFIEAEIETYIREMEGKQEDDKNSDDSADEDNVEKTKTRKTGPKKRSDSDESIGPNLSQAELEREYILASVVSTFGRAVRTGVIDVRLSVVLLTHYGQLGTLFDQWVKVVVEVLREEGMYKSNGLVVVEVVTKSLRESFGLYLDGSLKIQEHTISLAKALQSCFVIRGAHLSITRRLASEYVMQIHTVLLTWIIKRIAAYEKSDNKTKRVRAIAFFRALTQLLAAIQSRDALKIKSHLDHSLTQAELEVPPSAKAWEPLRSYEKRLVTAMSRDKAIVSKSKKVQDASRPSEVLSSDDEREVHDIVASDGSPLAPSARKPATMASAAGENDVFGSIKATAQKPRPRPKPRPTTPSAPYGSSPDIGITSADAGTDNRDSEISPTGSARPANGHATDLSPRNRKRAHEDGENSRDEDEGGDAAAEAQATFMHKIHEKPSSQESHISVADMKSRRKRIRR